MSQRKRWYLPAAPEVTTVTFHGDDEGFKGDLSKSRASNMFRRIQAQLKYGSRVGVVLGLAFILLLVFGAILQRKLQRETDSHQLSGESETSDLDTGSSTTVQGMVSESNVVTGQKKVETEPRNQVAKDEKGASKTVESGQKAVSGSAKVIQHKTRSSPNVQGMDSVKSQKNSDVQEKNAGAGSKKSKDTKVAPKEVQTVADHRAAMKAPGSSIKNQEKELSQGETKVDAALPAMEKIDEFDDTPHYLLMDVTFGTLSQRIMTICNAIVVAKRHGLTIIMPPVFMERGAIATMPENKSEQLSMMDTYVDHGIFVTGTDYIEMSHFMVSKDGVRFTGSKNSTRAAVPFFMAQQAEEASLKRFYRRNPWNFNVVVPKNSTGIYPSQDFIHDQCWLSLHRADYVMQHCRALVESKAPMKDYSCRLVLLDDLFTDYRNCTPADSMVQLVTKIQPIPTLKVLTQRMIDTFRVGSFVAVELHHDIEDDKNDAVTEDQFFRKMAEHIKHHMINETSLGNTSWNALSYYVVKGHGRSLQEEAHVSEPKYEAVDSGDMHNLDAFEKYLKAKYHMKTILDHSAIVKFWAEQMENPKPYRKVRDSYLLYGFLELWTSVQADVFIGRAKSSFGFLVSSYRRRFRPEAGTYLL